LAQFGGARLLTSRLAGTLAPPKVQKCTATGYKANIAAIWGASTWERRRLAGLFHINLPARRRRFQECG
jgi:hypothetical protein